MQKIKEFIGFVHALACLSPPVLRANGLHGASDSRHHGAPREARAPRPRDEARSRSHHQQQSIRRSPRRHGQPRRPSMPVSTIRAWTIGVAFSCLLAFVNQLFSIRQPPIRFDTNMAQLLAYPVGKAWEKWMPKKEMRVPFTSQIINLNPGRFNKKEHMLIAIMANRLEACLTRSTLSGPRCSLSTLTSSTHVAFLTSSSTALPPTLSAMVWLA